MPKIIKRDFAYKHQEVSDAIKEIDSYDLSDEEREKFNKFKSLEIYQQDLFMLYSQGYSLREIAEKLCVSYGWVNDRLKEIKKILK